MEQTATVPASEQTLPKPETKPTEQPEPPDPVDRQGSEDMISKANTAAARLEAANLEMAKLIAQKESLMVEKTLGGQTTAGVEVKEETPEEYAKKLLSGVDPNDK